MGANPFHHVFDPAFRPRCERAGGVHQGSPPFFELGCGHCVCANCALLAAAEECPLCGWQPHPAVAAMYSRYAGGVRVVGHASIAVAHCKANDLFNAFGFYLGASLCADIAARYLAHPQLVLCEMVAQQAIASAFASVGQTVPDQYPEAVLAARSDVVRGAGGSASADAVAELLGEPRSSPAAAVLACGATNLTLLMGSSDERQCHIFDPYGVGRDRLPYIASFAAPGPAARHIWERLAGGGAGAEDVLTVHMVEPRAGAPCLVRPVEATAEFGLTFSEQQAVSGRALLHGSSAHCSSAALRSCLASERSSSLISAASHRSAAPGAALWHSCELGARAVAAQEAAERRELRDWERCAAGTVRCRQMLLRQGTCLPPPSPQCGPCPPPPPPSSDDASRRLDFSGISIGSPAGSPLRAPAPAAAGWGPPLPQPRRPNHAAPSCVSSSSAADCPAPRLSRAELQPAADEEQRLRAEAQQGERRARAALGEWERMKRALAESRSGRPPVRQHRPPVAAP